jgi:hypothetical protein
VIRAVACKPTRTPSGLPGPVTPTGEVEGRTPEPEDTTEDLPIPEDGQPIITETVADGVSPKRCKGRKYKRGPCRLSRGRRSSVNVIYFVRSEKCIKRLVIRSIKCEHVESTPSVIVTTPASSVVDKDYECTGKMDMERSDQVTLNVDEIHSSKFIISSIRMNKDSKCVRKCLTNKKCQSLTVQRKSDEGDGKSYLCTLWSVKPKDLSRELLSIPYQFNANSALFVKNCKEACKGSRVIRRKPCECLKESDNLICFRRYILRVDRHKASGRCESTTVEIRVPCQHSCENNLPGESCQCEGSVTYEAACKEEKQTVFVTEYQKRFGVCTMQVRKKESSCESTPSESCSENQGRGKLVVFPCIGGSRDIVQVRYTNDNGLCVRHLNKIVKKCDGCPTCLDEEVSRCSNGRRQRIRHWFNRENECCKRQKYVEQLSCHNCPQDQVIKSKCRLSFQIVRRYVWYNLNGQCVSQVLPRIKRCF